MIKKLKALFLYLKEAVKSTKCSYQRKLDKLVSIKELNVCDVVLIVKSVLYWNAKLTLFSLTLGISSISKMFFH